MPIECDCDGKGCQKCNRTGLLATSEKEHTDYGWRGEDPKLRAAVRRLVQKIAENIDPDVTVEKVNIGKEEKPYDK